MGAVGSPYAAFRRAIEARNLTRAITDVRDWGDDEPVALVVEDMAE